MTKLHGWKVLGPVGLSMLALLALIAGFAGVNGGGLGGFAASAPMRAGYGAIPNTIAVSGYGDASGTPDTAYVQLGVSATDANVGQAVARANDTMTAVRDALIEAGIDEHDLQTIGFNVWPEDRYDPATGAVTGERVYHVDNMINVKVRDINQVSHVIETALEAGANSISGLYFGVEDTTTLENEARTEAVANARARAQQMADVLGVKLGNPIIIAEGAGGYPQPVYGLGMGGGADAGVSAAPAISPGQTTISVAISVVFSITQ